jgi:hypothetical protein
MKLEQCENSPAIRRALDQISLLLAAEHMDVRDVVHVGLNLIVSGLAQLDDDHRRRFEQAMSEGVPLLIREAARRSRERDLTRN